MVDLTRLEHYTLKYNPIVAALVKLALWPFYRTTKAYLFVATTGRSGTASLEKILSQIDGCIALHEGYPMMNGYVMQELNNNRPTAARNTYNFIRAINIRRSGIGYKYYAETNHMFIKSFNEFAIKDLANKLKVIHLVRDPIQVAKSITLLEHYPGTEMGNNWYLDYRAPGNHIQISDLLDNDPKFSLPFYKSLWYWYEIESRVESMRERHKELPIYELTTENLNNAEALCKLLSDMNLDYDRKKILTVAKTRENRKLSLKPRKPVDLGDTKKMHDDFKQLLIDNGYRLPSSLNYF
jgi:hypothetical protein